MTITTDYKKFASVQFKTFIIENLKKVYEGVEVKPKLIPESMNYKLHNDGDRIGVEEIATFTMTDGKQYSVYYEHKGFNSFQLVK